MVFGGFFIAHFLTTDFADLHRFCLATELHREHRDFRRGLTPINTAFCFSHRERRDHREKIKEIEPQILQITQINYETGASKQRL